MSLMRTSETLPFRSAVVASAATLALAILLAACASSPGHRLTRDDNFSNIGPGKTPWRTVAVLPFGGNPAMRRTAAEWFAHRLRSYGIVDVVDPASAEAGLRRKGTPPAGEEGYAPDGARRAGTDLGVGGVIFGVVSSPDISKEAFGRPAVSATLLDVASGRVVAEALSPMGFFVGNSFEDRLAAAVDDAVSGFLPVLYSGAGKTAPPPPPTGDGGTPR